MEVIGQQHAAVALFNGPSPTGALGI